MKSIRTTLLLPLLLCGLFAASGVFAANPKVLVYMFDGARADLFEALGDSAWKMLKENSWAPGYRSAWSICAEVEPDSETSSAPNHTTIATGKLVKNHNVPNNKVFSKFDMAATPTWLERIARRYPQTGTLFAFSWRPDLVLATRSGRCFFLCGNDVNNNLVLQEILKRPDAPSALMVFDDALDGAGHGYGFYPHTPEYLQQGAVVMKRLSALLAAIKARPTFADEDWLIVLCSDHGGFLKSHGMRGGQCSTVPLLYCGKSIPAGMIPGIPGNIDIAAQVLRHFGLADEVAQLDGQGVITAKPVPAPRPGAEGLLYDLAIRSGKVVNTAPEAAKYGVTPRGELVVGDGFFSNIKGGCLVLDGLKNFSGKAFTFALTFRGDLAKVQGDPAIFANKNWQNGLNPGFALVARRGGISFNSACQNAPLSYLVTNSKRMDVGAFIFPAGEKTMIAVSVDPDGAVTFFQKNAAGQNNWFCVNAAGVRPLSPNDWVIGQDSTGKDKCNMPIEVTGFRFWDRALTIPELRAVEMK